MQGMKKYEPIGKYVHLVDERNTNLAISNLLGVAKEKVFMPSVANIVGTDLSKYKVIRKGRFACNLMHVSRDEVLPVSLYTIDEPAIISPAYPMFEVNDTNELLPEYLHLYLMRREFDREVVFYAMNGVRGGLEWDDFMNMQLPIPDIDEQRRIVAEYQTIEKRIKNNDRLIKKLEDAVQAIYYHLFVEKIDLDNLPAGWQYSDLNSITESTIGGDWGKEYPEGNFTHRVLCIRGADTPSLRRGVKGVIPVRYILNKNALSRKLLNGDIVVEMSGGTPSQSTGRSAQMNTTVAHYYECDTICSNFCRVIRPKKPFAAFYNATFNKLFLSGTFFKHENSTNGLKNLDLEAVLTEEKVIIPPASAALEFSSIAENINNYICRIGQEQDILNRILSLLLIKIM